MEVQGGPEGKKKVERRPRLARLDPRKVRRTDPCRRSKVPLGQAAPLAPLLDVSAEEAPGEVLINRC